MAKKSDDFSQEQLADLLKQPQAQALLQRLQQMDQDALQQAVRQAMGGDIQGAKQTLDPMLSDPLVQDLTGQMRDGYGRV